MSEVPKALKPYLFHGVELDWSSGSKNAKGDCPFCGKVGKFGVNTEDGRYGCFSCDGGTEGGKGGNVLTFLRALWSVSFDATSAAAIQELAAERKVSPDALIAWGVAKSITTADWIVPGHSADSSRSIGQLYRYALSQGKRRLLATPGVPIRMFGLTEWNKSAETVYVCEGPWDGMALWDALRTAKQTDEGLVETSNRKSSLLATAAVVSVPGCGSFQKPWASFINGRKVVLMFDNDHPTEKNPVPPSLAGATRTASMLKGDVSALRWGPEGYNKHLPNGYDVRDHLSSGQGLTTLLNMVEPLSKSANVAAGGDETADLCLECPDWKTLINAWRRALKWTPGLELALSAMLASVVSTKTAGDQLWVKVVGPPACLDGGTPIHDPVDGSTKTVEERWRDKRTFNVWTRREDGSIGIGAALPPEKFPDEPIYEVTFASGRTIQVTLGHRFWNGTAYVALRSVVDELRRCASYRLPTIEDNVLSSQLRDALRSLRTTGDSRSGCRPSPRSCGGRPLLDGGGARCASPSRDGAQALETGRRSGLLVGEQARTRRASSCEGHGSSSTAENLAWERAGEAEHQPLSGHLEDGGCSFQGAVPSLGETTRTGTEQRRSRSAQGSSGSGSRLLPLGGSCSRALERHEALLRYPLGTSRIGTSARNGQSSLGTNRASLLAETEHRSSEGTSGQCPIRPASQPTLPQESSRTGTDERLPAVDLGSKAGPSWYSVTRVEGAVDRSTLADSDDIVKVEYVGDRPYFDFHVPETNNYWACGVFNHNCGKSTLCEALSTARRYVEAKSTIRGFHSGFGEEGEDNSLLSRLRDKTLVIKDGDTLLQSPNLGQILSEARDIYDRVSRTHYRNRNSRSYEGVNLTMILCGTSSLRSIDQSELGERFLDCVIMDRIDEDLEDEILWRKINRVQDEIRLEATGDNPTAASPDMLQAMGLTGGYVNLLRETAVQRFAELEDLDDAAKKRLKSLGKFVAIMRARPSLKQEEVAEREFAARLVSQLARMAMCLAVVMNRPRVDDYVLERVSQIAFDTARGVTMALASRLREAGSPAQALALRTGQKDETTRKLLRFLGKIDVVETYKVKDSGSVHWRLTGRFAQLWDDVHSIT